MQLKIDSDDFVFKQYDGTEVFRVEDNGDFDVAGGAGNTGATITSTGQLTTDGRIIVDDTTDATSTTDGSLQTDGGLSVAKDAVMGNDVKLLSDSAVLSLGAGSDATLTHDGTTGLTIAATPISVDSTGSLDLSSTTGDINLQASGTNQLSIDMDGTAGEVIMQLKVDSDDFVFKQYDGTEVFRVEDNGDFDVAGGAGNTGATITSTGQLTTDGRIIVDDTTDATSTTDGSLQTDGGLSVAKVAVIGDDLDLLSNGAIMNIGDSQKFTITHQNSNNTVKITQGHRLAFGDAGEYISGDGTDLKIESSGDVDITATLVDVSGELTTSGATSLATAGGVVNIASVGANTVIKGNLVVEGQTTLQQGAGEVVSATTLTASSTTTLNAKLTVNSNADISENLNVFGNLNVTGNINQINSDQINVLDKNIVLASNNNNDSYINGAGLILKSNSDKKF